jgi:hypothetical protein
MNHHENISDLLIVWLLAIGSNLISFIANVDVNKLEGQIEWFLRISSLLLSLIFTAKQLLNKSKKKQKNEN